MFSGSGSSGARVHAREERESLLADARRQREVRAERTAASAPAIRIQCVVRAAKARNDAEAGLLPGLAKKTGDLSRLAALLRAKGANFAPPLATLAELTRTFLVIFQRRDGRCLSSSAAQTASELFALCSSSTKAVDPAFNCLAAAAADDTSMARLRRLCVCAVRLGARPDAPGQLRLSCFGFLNDATLVGSAGSDTVRGAQGALLAHLLSQADTLLVPALRSALLSVQPDAALVRTPSPSRLGVDAAVRWTVAACSRAWSGTAAGAAGAGAPLCARIANAFAQHVCMVPLLAARAGLDGGQEGDTGTGRMRAPARAAADAAASCWWAGGEALPLWNAVLPAVQEAVAAGAGAAAVPLLPAQAAGALHRAGAAPSAALTAAPASAATAMPKAIATAGGPSSAGRSAASPSVASTPAPVPAAAAAAAPVLLSSFGMFGLAASAGAAAAGGSSKPGAAAAALLGSSSLAPSASASAASVSGSSGSVTSPSAATSSSAAPPAASPQASAWLPNRLARVSPATARQLRAWPMHAYILGNVASLITCNVTLHASTVPSSGAAGAAGPSTSVVLASQLSRGAVLASMRIIMTCRDALPASLWHSASPMIWVPSPAAAAGPASGGAVAGSAASGGKKAVGGAGASAASTDASIPVAAPPLLLPQLRSLSSEALAKALARACTRTQASAFRTPSLRLPDEDDPEAGSYDHHSHDVAATGHTSSGSGSGSGGAGGGSSGGAARGTSLSAAPSLGKSLLRGAWETSKLALSFFARSRKHGSEAPAPASAPASAAAAVGGAGAASLGGSSSIGSSSAASRGTAAVAATPLSPSALAAAAEALSAGAAAAAPLPAGQPFDSEALSSFVLLYAPWVAPRPASIVAALNLGGPGSVGGPLEVDADPVIGRLHLLNALAYTPSLSLCRAVWAFACDCEAVAAAAAGTPLVRDRAFKGSWTLAALPEATLTLLCALLAHVLPVADDFELYGAGGAAAAGGAGAASDGSASASASASASGSRLLPPLRELRHVVRLLRDALAHAEGVGVDTPASLKSGLSSAREEALTRLSAPASEGWVRFASAAASVLRSLQERHAVRPLGPQSMWLLDVTKVALCMPPATVAAAAAAGMAQTGRHANEAEAAVYALLRVMPFAVPFETRAALLEGLRIAEVARWQTAQPQVPITVRRADLWSSAFASLSALPADAWRRKIAVTWVSADGRVEAGIDAGGPFKDLITEMSKFAFDADYGLWKATEAGGELYPNPSAELLSGLPVGPAFELCGRLIGKALLEGITVGPCFARFFLHRALGRPPILHHLPSLDPELYRSLMFLRSYDGDVADLALTFTVGAEMGAGTGAGAEIELIPGGRDIPVTAANRLAYIYAVAKWRLATSIAQQTEAFLRGMRDVLPQSWLAPFSAPELQVLISGTPGAIDIADLAAHTRYEGGLWVHDASVRAFWKVAQDLSQADRAALLRFVTAAERPPPAGFRQLYPPFTIARLETRGRGVASADDLLPTASTCFNILRLPAYSSADALKKQLLTAIRSGTGFELT